jgi:hypothetical protein
MKTLMLAVTALVFAVAMNLSPALAANTRTPHYEWQYHYVGHHPHYQGDWVLVR